MKRFFSVAATAAVLTIIGASHGDAVAQQARLAPGQVAGAELQKWVDADGLALAGLDLRRSCQFMAKNNSAERHLSVFCPGDTAPWAIKGEAKVVGDSWCVKFRYPDGTADQHCEEFFKIGDNRYEIRVNGTAQNRVSRLIP